MYVLAAGVLLGGGIDQILGNKRGYGKCLEEGFMLMGPTALSMVGMLCLIPLISHAFRTFVVPIFTLTGADPSVLGGILAIDMGGYQLAKELANNPQVGSYAGVLIASTFGCTLVFTIPVGMEIMEDEDRGAFAKGILTGLAEHACVCPVPASGAGTEMRAESHDERVSGVCQRYEASDYSGADFRSVVVFPGVGLDTGAGPHRRCAGRGSLYWYYYAGKSSFGRIFKTAYAETVPKSGTPFWAQ